MNRLPRSGLIDTGSSRRRRSAGRRRLSNIWPSIEGLENRTLLSTITWDSVDYPTGGTWDNAMHWMGVFSRALPTPP